MAIIFSEPLILRLLFENHQLNDPQSNFTKRNSILRSKSPLRLQKQTAPV